MLESAESRAAATAVVQRDWRFTLDPFQPVRRPTRVVRVGDVAIGGPHPIRIQSMTVADTLDTEAVVAEICALHAAGCEIVRVTTPNRTSAAHLAVIKRELGRRGVQVPLVADVHFTPQAALIAALHADKVRINPGNYADRKHFVQREYSDAEYAAELQRLEEAFRPLVLRCRERGVAMRIGTNHGSLSDRILNRYGDTPLGMVESALEFVRICEHHGYRDLVLSMKASDVKVMIQAYRLLALRMRELGMDYPFHLGVTEAGAGLGARVKSAAGIGSLLADGIGDTIRVSLTEDSVREIPVARTLVARVGLPAATVPSATPEGIPPWSPLSFARRRIAPLGVGAAALVSDQPPRIEVVGAADVVAGALLEEAARTPGPAEAPAADLVLLHFGGEPSAETWRGLEALRAARLPSEANGRSELGIELPLDWLATGIPERALHGWSRLSLVVDDAAQLRRLAPPASALPPLQYTLRVDLASPNAVVEAAAALAATWDARAWPPGAVALTAKPGAPEASGTFVGAWRRFLAAWPGEPMFPVILRRSPAVDLQGDDPGAEALEAAIALGALLADGVGDAVQLPAERGCSLRDATRFAAEILQATRLRLSRADFIACPSCGRTQFDLQSTTARIEARLRHLEGLKIAVMGCIVNGPGEMADADFGYVGSGPGRIDLYVGRERVRRNLPQEEAVEQLVDLIRSRGRWVEPGPAETSPSE